MARRFFVLFLIKRRIPRHAVFFFHPAVQINLLTTFRTERHCQRQADIELGPTDGAGDKIIRCLHHDSLGHRFSIPNCDQCFRDLQFPGYRFVEARGFVRRVIQQVKQPSHNNK